MLELCLIALHWTIGKLLTPGDTWPWRPGWLENRASCVRGWAHHTTGRVGNWPLHRHRRTIPTRSDTRPEENKRRIIQVLMLRLSICLWTSLKCPLRWLNCHVFIVYIQIKTFSYSSRHYRLILRLRHYQTCTKSKFRMSVTWATKDYLSLRQDNCLYRKRIIHESACQRKPSSVRLDFTTRCSTEGVTSGQMWEECPG